MRLLPFLPLVLSGCALFTLAATKRSHPTLAGQAQASGLAAPMQIHRDDYGVPHVRGASEDDAWFGLGYVHAQDRLFQADLSRRLSQGKVSEWLGEGAVPLDGFAGSMRLRELGEKALAEAAPETKAMVKAYTAGLNAGAASLRVLPVEYRLLGVPFEPWEEVDTTGLLFLQGWSLQENLDHELASLAFDHLAPEDLDALFQTYPNTPRIDDFWEQLRAADMGELSEGFKGFTGALGGRPEGNAEASNNWVIDGSRSASGKPILANDPHLVQRVPSLWYAADVSGGGLHVAGATLPGTPGFPVGHNENVAWGLTNVMADVVDLAVLQRTDRGVLIDGEEEAIEQRVVSLKPKDADPLDVVVPWTSLGPVINEGGDVVVVLRWAALEFVDHSQDMLHAFATSETVEPLHTKLRTLPSAAPQNVLLADTEGTIGWTVVGTLPQRRGYTGRVPYPHGHSVGWDGWIDDLPGSIGSEDGFLATANNKPDHPSADAIATAYLPPHRVNRIKERLAAMESATPEDLQALHLDVQDGAAMAHLPGLLEGVTFGEECLDILQKWDRVATVDSKGALVWAKFQEELFEEVFSEWLRDDELSLLLDLMSTGRNPLDGDFARFVPDREATVGRALTSTCDALRERWGDSESWRWGDAHTLRLKHPFAAQSSLLSGWNMEPVPFPGSGATVAAADYDWTAEDWDVGFMASLRIVMPLDDLGASTFVHPGGQSGQPGSEFYASHYPAFVAGETLPLWFDDDDVSEHTIGTIELRP